MKNRWFILCFLTFNLFAQQANLELIVSSEDVAVGEQITVTVKSNVSGNIKINFPPEFNEGYSVVNGMKQEMDYTSGKFVSLYYLSKDGTFTKTGDFTIGPATIKNRGKVLKSNTVTVKVGKGSTKSNGNSVRNSPSQNSINNKQKKRVAAYGIIGLSKKKVYEGEPLIAKSYVYARFRPTHLESYQTFEMMDVMDAHSLSQGNQINLEEKSIGGERMFVFSMDPKLAFPVKTGEHIIKPFQLELMSGFRGFPFESNSPSYEVIPLPKNQPYSFKGGVGDFSITRTISSDSYKQGDVVQMDVQVTGVGNIHLLQEPDIDLPDNIQVYGDPIIKEDFKFNNKGAEGKVTYTYNIQLLDSGQIKIPKIRYAYFDLKKEEYVVLKSPSINLTIKGDPNFELITDLYKTDTNLIELDDELIDETNLSKNNRSSFSSLNYILTSSLVIVILVLLYFLLKNKRQSVNKKKELPQEDEKELHEEKEIVTYVDIKNNIRDIDDLYQNGEEEALYSLIQNTLVTHLKNEMQFNHEVVIVNTVLIDKLDPKLFNSEKLKSIKFILKTCETARYGLVLGLDEREKLYISFRSLVS
jgi:hypothetical protein